MGTSQWGVGESRVAARGRRQGRSRGVHTPGPVGPVVHHVGGPAPAIAGPSTCGQGALGAPACPPLFWRAQGVQAVSKVGDRGDGRAAVPGPHERA